MLMADNDPLMNMFDVFLVMKQDVNSMLFLQNLSKGITTSATDVRMIKLQCFTVTLELSVFCFIFQLLINALRSASLVSHHPPICTFCVTSSELISTPVTIAQSSDATREHVSPSPAMQSWQIIRFSHYI